MLKTQKIVQTLISGPLANIFIRSAAKKPCDSTYDTKSLPLK